MGDARAASGSRLEVATGATADACARNGPTIAARIREPLVWLVLAAVLGAGLSFRLAVVTEFQAPAGDGRQYHKLSQELARSGRFTYGRNEPLTFTRLPGYPLFLAYVAVRKAPVDLKTHLQKATRWNALFDVCTAFLVFVLLRERRMGLGAGLLAAALVIVCPPMIILSAYGLTESLATLLTTLAVVLALGAMRGRVLVCAALAGCTLGLLQLVRPDGIAVAPAIGLALLFGAGSLRRRLSALGVCVLAAAVVFAPWPIRNLKRFGSPHPFGTQWVALDGKPLRTGFQQWMMTWAKGDKIEEYLLLMLARRLRLDPEKTNVLPWHAYDSAEERQRVEALYRAHSVSGLSAEVDAGFRALARERLRRRPFRTLAVLPAQRILAMSRPLPDYDFPMRSAILRLPERRARYAVFDRWAMLLAVAGALALLVRRRREGVITLAVLGTAVAGCLVLHAYAHPSPVQRYVLYVCPLVLALAAFGISSLFRLPVGVASLVQRLTRSARARSCTRSGSSSALQSPP